MWLLVTTGGLFAVVASIAAVLSEPRLAAAAFLFAIAGGIAETFKVPIPSSRSGHSVEMAVSGAVYVAAILVFPLPWAVLVVASSYALSEIASRKKPWFKVAFNVAQGAASALVAASVWRLGGQATVTLIEAIPWLVATSATWFAVNSLLVSTIVSLASGLPLALTWWRSHRNLLTAELGMLLIGPLIAVLWTTAPWCIALAAAPLAGLYYAHRNAVALETQTLDALFQLADILDDRDPYTHGHSLRVGEYAEQLAFALAIPSDRAHLIFLAGRLHDIGKCAIRNEVLLKPGPLDPDERDHMCQHPAVGGAMLSKLEFFKQCAEYVRGHHERWDGLGYPDGLSGDRIPLGARIIAVVDAYDAMTTTRPYRQALPRVEAVRRLREGAGTQWDPTVVAAFLDLVERQTAPRSSPLRATPTLVSA